MGKRRNFRWVYSWSLLAVTIVACSGVYAFWQSSKSKPGAIPEPAANSPRRSLAQQPKSLPTPGASKTGNNASAKGFTLELSATEPAWLSIVTDGRILFKGILERAQTKTLEGKHTARIHTANAGAVEVVFNGKALGALGSRGQVRTVVFTKNAYAVVENGARASLRLSPAAVRVQPRTLQQPLLFAGL